VFLVLDGSRPMTRRAIQNRFMNLAAAAGIPPEKHLPHSMRHGFATRMLFETKTIVGVYTVSSCWGILASPRPKCICTVSRKHLEEAMLADPLGAGV